MKLYYKSLIISCALALLSLSHEVLAGATVNVTNYSMSPVVAVLVRTEKSLKDSNNLLYVPTQEDIDAVQDLQVAFILPGDTIPLNNYPAAYTKYDRDLWVSKDIKSLKRAVDYGRKRSPQIAWHNVGGMAKNVYIGGKADGPSKIFTNPKKALEATGSWVSEGFLKGRAERFNKIGISSEKISLSALADKEPVLQQAKQEARQIFQKGKAEEYELELDVPEEQLGIRRAPGGPLE